MMKTQNGLPIAAHMGFLVALAFASAFVAILAVVIWLPPRPPDVMRADVVAEQFQAGFDHMLARGSLPRNEAMAWRLRAVGPPRTDAPHMQAARMHLARRLRLAPDQVRFEASRIVRNETFVFRVRDAEDHVRMHGGDGLIAPPGIPGAPRAPSGRRTRTFEFHIPPSAPAPTEGAAPAAAPTPPMPPAPPMFAPAPPGVLLLSGFEIGAQLPDGRWLVMRQGRNRDELSWIGRAALIIGGTLTTLSLLALFFARRLTRPIRNFSDAVQAVGVNPQSEPVREEGPRELRGAARAVNAMQARLRALIADRTKTLAAVAHDMRTPLMRLRLVAENASPEQRERMAKEIGEVEALVAGFIAFARDDPAEEPRVRIDLGALLQSIVDDCTEAGQVATYAGEERVVVTGQSLGLKRLFANLVGNALKYGERARIVLRREAGTIIVDVEDDGPGVPADQREHVFEPFVRLNEAAGGAGLGLPAARSIARAHGGDIVILNAEKGALLRVTLPG